MVWSVTTKFFVEHLDDAGLWSRLTADFDDEIQARAVLVFVRKGTPTREFRLVKVTEERYILE